MQAGTMKDIDTWRVYININAIIHGHLNHIPAILHRDL